METKKGNKNEWLIFLRRLEEAYANKWHHGLSVPAIVSLIYAGAMDSIAPELITQQNILKIYDEMLSDVKKALKSKACKPKRRKNEILGISDIKSYQDLLIWRSGANPVVRVDMIAAHESIVRSRGYTKKDGSSYWLRQSDSNRGLPMAVLTDRLSEIYKLENTPLFRDLNKGVIELHVLGAILDAEIKKYANNSKEMLKFKLFTGYELSEDIVAWPGQDGRIKESVKLRVKNREVGVAVIRPSIKDGRRSASLVRWEGFLYA